MLPSTLGYPEGADNPQGRIVFDGRDDRGASVEGCQELQNCLSGHVIGRRFTSQEVDDALGDIGVGSWREFEGQLRIRAQRWARLMQHERSPP